MFCDQGVPDPTGGPSVYAILTGLLVERGVARSSIGWVHDWPDPATRQTLWDQVRTGQIRVLIGSTQQMGIGVNIQTRLYAAHELTAPYRPDWLTQAEGRMIRQGNHHPRVELHRYVSERTADATSWSILHRKAHFIHVAMSHPDRLTRDLRDESVQTPAEEFAQIAALATGDPRHIELATLTATLARLERAERAHHTAIASQQRSLAHTERALTELAARIAVVTALTPTPDADPAPIGAALLTVGRGEHDLTLAGVTYRASRDSYGLALDIAGTGLGLRFDPARLTDRTDAGRGLGVSVINLHHKLPTHLSELHQKADRTVRQRHAEHARPVPTQFPRASELVDTRTRHRALLHQLTRHTADGSTSASAASVALAGSHPIYGQANPTMTQRHEWVGAFRHYDPHRPAHWGNRAHTDTDWADAVNLYATNPSNQHPSCRHDIGIVRGIALTARITFRTMIITPRVPADPALYPAWETTPGHVTTVAVATWLAGQHRQARVERNALNAVPDRVLDAARTVQAAYRPER